MNHKVKIILGCLPLLLVYAAQAMEAPLSRAIAPQVQQLSLSSNHLLAARLAHITYYTPEEDAAKAKNNAEIDTNKEILLKYPLLNSMLQAHKIDYLGSITAGKNKQVCVLAFYAPAEKRILYVVRGTVPSNIKNLFADLGIGRHKSNDDLIRSLDLAQKNLKEQGVADHDTTNGLLEGLRALIAARVTSHNPAYRAVEPLYKGVVEGASATWTSLRDTITAPLSSSANKTALAGAALGLGVATVFGAPLAVSAAGYAVGSAAINVAWNGGSSTVKAISMGTLTLNDGYEELMHHTQLLWASSQKLKAFAQQKGLAVDNALWIGHSLGGWLALFGAILSESEAIGFNPPGLTVEEALAIASQAGIITAEQVKDLTCRRAEIASKLHSIRMSTCTIGMLGNRDGKVTEFAAATKETPSQDHFVSHRRNLRSVHRELIGKIEKKKPESVTFGTVVLEEHSMRHLMLAIAKQQEHDHITPATWNRDGLGQRRAMAQIRPDMLRTLKEQAFAEAIQRAHKAEGFAEAAEPDAQVPVVVNDVPQTGWLSTIYWGSYFSKKS